jgi:hypothetical protein
MVSLRARPALYDASSWVPMVSRTVMVLLLGEVHATRPGAHTARPPNRAALVEKGFRQRAAGVGGHHAVCVEDSFLVFNVAAGTFCRPSDAVLTKCMSSG